MSSSPTTPEATSLLEDRQAEFNKKKVECSKKRARKRQERDVLIHQRKEKANQDAKLVELVQKYPYLYDTSNILHKDKKKSAQAWLELSIDTGIVDPSRRFSNLKVSYNRVKKNAPSGSSPTAHRFALMEEMRFLDRVPKQKPTRGSYSSDGLQEPELPFANQSHSMQLDEHSPIILELSDSISSQQSDTNSNQQPSQTLSTAYWESQSSNSRSASTPSSNKSRTKLYKPKAKRIRTTSEGAYQDIIEAFREAQPKEPEPKVATYANFTCMLMELHHQKLAPHNLGELFHKRIAAAADAIMKDMEDMISEK